MDAYDVLCVRPGHDFLATYRSFGMELVIGSENFGHPLNQWRHGQGGNPFINAGFMVGTARVLAEAWTWCLDREIQDDQEALSLFVNTFPLRCTLDIESRLVFNDNMTNVEYDYCTTQQSIRLKHHQQSVLQPFFIHFPGMLMLNSIPLYQMFTGKLFGAGQQYDKVARALLGFEYMPVEMCDARSYLPGLWAERGILYCIIVALIAGLVVQSVRLGRRRLTEVGV